MSSWEEMGKDFQDSLKRFIVLSDGLSKNSLSRVTKALAAYPLEDDLIQLRQEKEFEIYEVGKHIQSIKIHMMVDSLQQDAEEYRVKQAKQDRNKKVPADIDKLDYAKQGELNVK